MVLLFRVAPTGQPLRLPGPQAAAQVRHTGEPFFLQLLRGQGGTAAGVAEHHGHGEEQTPLARAALGFQWRDIDERRAEEGTRSGFDTEADVNDHQSQSEEEPPAQIGRDAIGEREVQSMQSSKTFGQ